MSDTISLPSLAVLLALSFLAIRYFLLSPSSSASSQSSTTSRSRPADLAKVDQISRMFPQLERRSIAWDLSRNGGNVTATTEKVLSRGGLERPPTSYNPPNLTSTSGAGGVGAVAGASSSRAEVESTQDLISRYGLSEKIRAMAGETADAEEKGKGKGKAKDKAWASTKSERASLLAKRREEMILKARKDMEERVRREREGREKMVS